ncbi:hypothetical protein OAM75_00980 [Gammaproteobacteria bacterium]|jgi:hypothetical protein|nr:hypothetical protein [Gammaproteobacteria bacterium]MDC0413523.1 hypothetical protein [Gammaproteobacteria bacterium]
MKPKIRILMIDRRIQQVALRQAAAFKAAARRAARATYLPLAGEQWF